MRDIWNPRHPLQCYIRYYWLRHVRATSRNDPKAAEVTKALKKFIGEDGPHMPTGREYYIWHTYLQEEEPSFVIAPDDGARILTFHRSTRTGQICWLLPYTAAILTSVGTF